MTNASQTSHIVHKGVICPSVSPDYPDTVQFSDTHPESGDRPTEFTRHRQVVIILGLREQSPAPN